MNAPATAAATAAVQNSAPEFKRVPIAEIKLSTAQLQVRRRGRFDPKDLVDLTENVKALGVMQPVVVRHLFPAQGTLKFEMVAGERRYLAAKAAGLTELPAMVNSVSEALGEEMQISENLQRKSYHPLEEAEGFQRLCQIHKCSAKDLADRIGQNESHVHARLKLLALCPQVKEDFYARKLIQSVALEIARIPDDKMQQQAAKGCITGEDTGEFYRDGTGPLGIEEAREYIQTEFMVRVDGNRAIAQARKEKKPVIEGEEAAKIWRAQAAQINGYVRIEDTYWQGDKQKHFKEVISPNTDGIVLIQSPFTGEAVKCLPRDTVIEIFKSKKTPLPNDMKQTELPLPKPPASKSFKVPPAINAARGFDDLAAGSHKSAHADPKFAERAQKEAEVLATDRTLEKIRAERAARKVELAIDTNVAIFKAARARVPKKLGKQDLVAIIDLIFNLGRPDVSDALIESPHLSKCQERDLYRILFDLVHADNVERAEYDPKLLLATAKRYGVNIAKVTKEVTAAFNEREEQSGAPAATPFAKKPAAKKPAAKKKASKK